MLDEAHERRTLSRDDREAVLRQAFDSLLAIGDLLRLAFIVPRIVEKALRAPLDLADKGVFKIRLVLQVIDDITDLYADIREKKYNPLLSKSGRMRDTLSGGVTTQNGFP